MKIAGKRIPKGNALVFISFAAISLCLIMVISLSRQEKINNIIRKGLFTGHEKWFEISECEDESCWDGILTGLTEKHDDFALYVDLPDPEISVRGIYVSGEVVIPPMISGKYFDETSSGSSKPTVVLGKEYESNIISRDGKKYYDYHETQCEVIGIMGTQKDSRINHMIVMDFKNALNFTGINTDYTYDVKDKEDLADVGQYINESFQGMGQLFMSQNSYSGATTFVSFLFSEEVIMDTVYIMMLISFVVSTVLVTFIWLRNRETLFKSWDLCGFRFLEKVNEIAKRYYIISFGGFIFGLIIILCLGNNMDAVNVSVIDVIQSFAFTIGIGTTILVCSLIRRLFSKI